MVNNKFNLCKIPLAFMWWSQWNQAISKTKGDSMWKLHLVVNEYGTPINFTVTDGSRTDCKAAIQFNQGY